MLRHISGVVILLLCALSVLAQCTCHKIEKGETTHWGGNQLIVQDEGKPYQRLRGIVLDSNGDPMSGALVEVWDKPEYLLSAGSRFYEERAKQQRLKACRTANDGKFCFHVKPGKYELRSSVGSG